MVPPLWGRKNLQLAAAQGWSNRTLIGHKRAIVHFVVLPGSLFSSTDITEYTYSSLTSPQVEFVHKSD